MSSKRIALVAAAVCSTAALVPSLSQAADFCVPDPGCSQGGGIEYSGLQFALAATESSPTSDRIFLGPGVWMAPSTSGFNAPLYPVQIIGAGRDVTTIIAPTNATPVLGLGNPASSVQDATIVAPAKLDALPKTVLSLGGGKATRISITPDLGVGAATTGVDLGGGELTDSSVTLPTAVSTTGVVARTDARMRNVDITAGQGIRAMGADVQIDRTRVHARYTGIFSAHLNTLITDTLIDVSGDGGYGISTADAGGTNVFVTARNVTINVPGASTYGVAVVNTTAHNVTAIVDSSVVRGAKFAFMRSATAPGGASIGVSYSDYDPAAISNGPGDGVIASGAGNINADPLFSGPLDFHPLTGSPLVDTGNPGSFSDTLDLDGNPRIVGGRRDMGAFEAPAPPPASSGDASAQPDPTPAAPAGVPAEALATEAAKDTIPPAISGLTIAPARFTLHRGSRISFTLSERATISVVLKRRAAHGSRLQKVATLRRPEAAGTGRVALRRRFAGATLRPGRYTALIAATDASGNRSRTLRLTFRVTR